MEEGGFRVVEECQGRVACLQQTTVESFGIPLCLDFNFDYSKMLVGSLDNISIYNI